MTSWFHGLLRHRPRTSAELGREGERRAATYLRLRAFRIIDRNVRSPRGEIDLVAKRGKLVLFVEVKTRQASDAGEPFEAVGREKQRRIISLAEAYCREHDLRQCSFRFDVLSIVNDRRKWTVTHFPDAFCRETDPQRPWLQR